MKVVEIFNSIDGEGKRVGLPTTFIRLHGCNLNCSYCDTRYGCEGRDYTEMSVEEIVDHVKEIGCKSITVTGGEPLIHPHIKTLLKCLSNEGFWVNVETNGTMDIIEDIGHVFYTVDYKCPSSNMNNCMSCNFDRLRYPDVLKFVVGSTEDLLSAKTFLDNHPDLCCDVYFSPVFGKIDPKDIVEFILNNRLWNVHVQLQLHKIIWDPNKRGV